MSSEKARLQIENALFIFKESLKTMGVLFSLMAILTTFISVDEMLDTINHNSISWKIAMLISICVISIVGTWIYNNTRNSITIYEKGRTSITFEYGDMQKDYIKDNTGNEPYTVVIPINTTIDDVFNENRIRKNSNHGYWISQMKSLGYSEDIIKDMVKDQMTLDKNGLCKQGSVCYLNNLNGNVNYILAATAVIDTKKKHSYCSRDQYYLGIHKIVDAISRVCNQGEKIVMPLIGGGYARMQKSEREIVPIMAEILVFNADKLKHDVHVVIYNKRRSLIPIFSLSQR